jgi:hypothetical protein
MIVAVAGGKATIRGKQTERSGSTPSLRIKGNRNRPLIRTLHTGKLLKNNHARPANMTQSSRRPWFVHFYRDNPLKKRLFADKRTEKEQKDHFKNTDGQVRPAA